MPVSAYRKSLLETPARVLAEDDEHVVVAVRIPKKTLRENLLLLTALAGMAVDSSAIQPTIETAIANRAESSRSEKTYEGDGARRRTAEIISKYFLAHLQK